MRTDSVMARHRLMGLEKLFGIPHAMSRGEAFAPTTTIQYPFYFFKPHQPMSIYGELDSITQFLFTDFISELSSGASGAIRSRLIQHHLRHADPKRNRHRRPLTVEHEAVEILPR